MSNRAFTKRVIEVTVYSEEPFEWDDLHDLQYIQDGLTGTKALVLVEETSFLPISGKEMADALLEHDEHLDLYDLEEDSEKGNEDV